MIHWAQIADYMERKKISERQYELPSWGKRGENLGMEVTFYTFTELILD